MKYGNLKKLSHKDNRPFDNYVREENLIYIYNNTSPRAEIIITMVSAVGKNHSYSIKIPRTFLPICISDQAPKEDIKNCRDLRKMSLSKHVVFVIPDEAIKILKTDEAKEELIRLNMYFDMSNEEKLNDEEKIIDKEKLHDKKPQEIDDRVIMLVQRTLDKDLTTKQLKTELRYIENDLHEKDLTYVFESFPDVSLIAAYVQKWLMDE